jgi:hypothetical protein
MELARDQALPESLAVNGKSVVRWARGLSSL